MSETLKTAAAYIRVSTERQTELSPESQIKEIQNFAKQNGYILPKEYIFRDDGISGKKAEKRPQFQTMIAVAKQKPSPFSTILIWKFSRFARNQEEAIVYKSMLKKNGISVVSISEPMDDSPYSTLIERIIEWMDEYYSIRLAGEVRRGLKSKLNKGEPTSPAPYGYINKNKGYIIDKNKAEIVKRIFNDYVNGKAAFAIARELNEQGYLTHRGNKWSSATVSYILRNPTYIGKLVHNNDSTKNTRDSKDITVIDGNHEAIICMDMWEKAQELLLQSEIANKKYCRKDGKSYKPYLLHGLLKCSSCGHAMVRTHAYSTYESYQCCDYNHGKCADNHRVHVKEMDKAVLDTIESLFDSNNFILDVRYKQDNKAKINSETLIAKEEQKLKRVMEAYEDGVYTLEEYKDRRTKIESHLEQLRNTEKVPQANEAEIRRNFVNEKKKLLKQLRKSNVDISEKNEILHSFVDKIIYDKKNNSISIFFYCIL